MTCRLRAKLFLLCKAIGIVWREEEKKRLKSCLPAAVTMIIQITIIDGVPDVVLSVLEASHLILPETPPGLSITDSI